MSRRGNGYGWAELIIGILLIIASVLTLMHPNRTLTVLVIIYGIIAIVTGISDILTYVRTERFTGFGPTVSLVTGVFGIMAGVMILAHPSVSMWVLLILIPIWVITHSISRLSHLNMIRQIAGNGYYYFTLIVNIIGLVLGILMIFRPMMSLFTAGGLIGVYLLLSGIDMVILAVQDMRYNW